MNISIENSQLRRDLNETGRWVRALAITTFVFLGLGALTFLLFFAGGSAAAIFGASEFAAVMGAGVFVVGVFAVVIFGLYFFLTLKFYRFGKALDFRRGDVNNEAIETGFAHLASLLKIFVLFSAVTFGLAIIGGAIWAVTIL